MTINIIVKIKFIAEAYYSNWILQLDCLKVSLTLLSNSAPCPSYPLVAKGTKAIKIGTNTDFEIIGASW